MPFVVIQVIMVCVVIAFPKLVTGNLEKSAGDPSKVQIIIPPDSEAPSEVPPDFSAPQGGRSGAETRSGASSPENKEADELQKQFGK